MILAAPVEMRASTDLSRQSDEDLAERCRDGCQASFEELVQRYTARLLRFLSQWTRNLHDAEDLLQETFAKAYCNIKRFDRSYRFSTWLFTIGARQATSFVRVQSRATCQRQIRDPAVGPAEAAAQQEERANLWAVARTLPRDQYRALWLRYAEGMGVEEISRVMRKSQVGVRVSLFRARKNMLKKLQGGSVTVLARGALGGQEGRAGGKAGCSI